MTKIELDNYTIHNLEQKNPTICCKQGQKRSALINKNGIYVCEFIQ